MEMNEPFRQAQFQRLPELEGMLQDINARLSPANIGMLQDFSPERMPKVFVHGPPRSGTTLFMQWLSDVGLAEVPTNLLSRFYGSPLVGARIQQILTDSRYNFRDEILDFNSEIDFRSENGKTRGALSPNEFWYFWRRFLPFDELDYLTEGEIPCRAHLDELRDELNALANIFAKPFALKAMIMNQMIPALSARFENALFVHIHRDPVFNIQSVLEARHRQYGGFDTWYSFRIREYPQLEHLSPLESVAGQVAAINRSIALGVQSVPERRRIDIPYEDFCANPNAHFERLKASLELLGAPLTGMSSVGPRQFEQQNHWRLKAYSQEEVEAAWSKMQAWAERAIARSC
ncbi:sulfotransferase [Arhodomonas sp. AD133]|uniref:sulfotransferase n=1 Tax=Arhodomonas sp. AD133 TaxID=3415009 RepID=UPI003EBE678B